MDISILLFLLSSIFCLFIGFALLHDRLQKLLLITTDVPPPASYRHWVGKHIISIGILCMVIANLLLFFPQYDLIILFLDFSILFLVAKLFIGPRNLHH